MAINAFADLYQFLKGGLNSSFSMRCMLFIKL